MTTNNERRSGWLVETARFRVAILAVAFLAGTAYLAWPAAGQDKPASDSAAVEKAELTMLRSTVKSQSEQLAALKAENTGLKAENAKLAEQVRTLAAQAQKTAVASAPAPAPASEPAKPVTAGDFRIRSHVDLGDALNPTYRFWEIQYTGDGEVQIEKVVRNKEGVLLQGKRTLKFSQLVSVLDPDQDHTVLLEIFTNRGVVSYKPR